MPQYVGLLLIPVHNYPFTIHPLSKSNTLSFFFCPTIYFLLLERANAAGHLRQIFRIISKRPIPPRNGQSSKRHGVWRQVHWHG
jgi:hypothetical protein